MSRHKQRSVFVSQSLGCLLLRGFPPFSSLFRSTLVPRSVPHSWGAQSTLQAFSKAPVTNLLAPILRNRSAAYRCSQTQPSTPEPPLVYVACVPTALFFEVIRTLQHKRPTRTGVSVRRLHLTFCQSCQADREQVPLRSLDVYQTLWHEGVITMHY
jgi:hypothetical protein